MTLKNDGFFENLMKVPAPLNNLIQKHITSCNNFHYIHMIWYGDIVF